jgi:uncharacterized coiled-coil protein SlyX
MNYNKKEEKVLEDIIFLEGQIKEHERKITNAQKQMQTRYQHYNIPEGFTLEKLDQLMIKSISESQKKISEIQEQIKLFLEKYPQVEPRYILHQITKE